LTRHGDFVLIFGHEANLLKTAPVSNYQGISDNQWLPIMTMVSLPTTLAEIARKCRTNGLRFLSTIERKQLRTLLQKELRKRSYIPTVSRPREILLEFCGHVIRGFDASANPVIVIDSLPYLHRNAKRLSKQQPPVASLILYAAWLEHWVNMMVTVAILREGHSPNKPQEFLKSQPRFKDKLSMLAKSLKLTSLPKKLRDAIIQVVDLRNWYVHFLWEGQSHQRLGRDIQTLHSVVNRCELLIAESKRFEYEQFDAMYVPLVARVMRVC
jgi:hypothetical protein